MNLLFITDIIFFSHFEISSKFCGCHDEQITELHQLCAVDFEWYLELYPNYYKAAYYLIKMNLNKDDSKCRALLLQMSRKNTEQIQGKKLSLFEIHRSRHLMKVISFSTLLAFPVMCLLNFKFFIRAKFVF